MIVTDESVVHEGPSHLDASWLIRGGSAPHAVLVLVAPPSYGSRPDEGRPRLLMFERFLRLGFQRITTPLVEASPTVVRRLSLVIGEMDEELVPSVKLRDRNATEVGDYEYAVSVLSLDRCLGATAREVGRSAIDTTR